MGYDENTKSDEDEVLGYNGLTSEVEGDEDDDMMDDDDMDMDDEEASFDIGSDDNNY